MAKKCFTSINQMIDDYKQKGYRHQQIELGLYSINEVEGLVSGYTPLVTINGKTIRLWCCSSMLNVNQSNVSTCWPHPHQWWMTNKVSYRRRIADMLIKDGIMSWQFSDFEELYGHLTNLGFMPGTLYHYDLARRIGHCLSINPKDYVYLHQGALTGAQILDKKGHISLPQNWSVRVETSIFSTCFPNVNSIDIENMLCIYKKYF